jgi:hypothetical protein
VFVVVVMDGGGGLASVCPRDASDVLNEAVLEGDGGGEEQGVECGAVEALADE